MIRFHLDESVNNRLAIALRQRGIDVTVSNDVGLVSASDERHLAFARVESRVLVTHDADFVAIRQGGAAHSGIAYCATAARTLGYLVRFLCLMHDCLTEEDMHNRVEYL